MIFTFKDESGKVTPDKYRLGQVILVFLASLVSDYGKIPCNSA